MSDLDEQYSKLCDVVPIKIDKTKCTTAEEFEQAEKEFNELYNSSPEMKKLIDSWK